MLPVEIIRNIMRICTKISKSKLSDQIMNGGNFT